MKHQNLSIPIVIMSNMRRCTKRTKEPELSEEALKDIMQSRLEVKEGKVIPIEKIYKDDLL